MISVETRNRDKLIPAKFDLVFKKVYGDEKNNIPIKTLLKEILGIVPVKIEVLNKEIIGLPYVDRNTLVDLIVELDDNSKIVIEVNTEVDTPIKDRNLFYICRVMSRDLKVGQNYDNLKKHILINLDFEGYHENPIMLYKLINEDTGKAYSQKLEIISIDIPYYSEKCYNNSEDLKKLTRKEKLLGLLDVDDKNLAEKLCEGDNDMEEIYNKIKECNEDEEIIGAYDAERHRSELERLGRIRAEKQGYEEGLNKGIKERIEQGIEQGIERGIEKEKELIAKNMIKLDIDIETISKATNLTISEIEELKK